jgi:hypothetical protein
MVAVAVCDGKTRTRTRDTTIFSRVVCSPGTSLFPLDSEFRLPHHVTVSPDEADARMGRRRVPRESVIRFRFRVRLSR